MNESIKQIQLKNPWSRESKIRGIIVESNHRHEREEAMPSNWGERKEVIPQESESDFSEEFEEL